MKTEQSGYAVWDWPVRLIHWSFPLGIAAMWWTGEQGLMDVHSKVGYALLVLVITRLFWGFVGSYHARFTSFIAGPRRISAYLRHPQVTVGHNPLGGWSVLALLCTVLLQAVSGLFTSDDILFEGPLAYWGGEVSGLLAEVHEINWIVMQALILLHLAAVVFYQWGRKQPLIQAMWWGSAPGKAASERPKPLYLAALIALVLAGALWWVLVNAPEAPSYW